MFLGHFYDRAVFKVFYLGLKFFMLALQRKASFWPPSVVYISVIITLINHKMYMNDMLQIKDFFLVLLGVKL